MKIKSILAGMFALAMFASCSNDSIDEPANKPAPGDSDAGLYMSVIVSMPNAGNGAASPTAMAAAPPAPKLDSPQRTKFHLCSSSWLSLPTTAM